MSESYALHVEIGEHQNSADFFKNVSSLLIGINTLNNAICASVNTEIDTEVMLECVSSGSLVAIVRDSLKKIPDESIMEVARNPGGSFKEAIGLLLVIGKRKMLAMLGDNEKIDAKRVEIAAKEAIEGSGLGGYGYRIDKSAILESLAQISQSSKGFSMPPIVVMQDENITLLGDYTFDLQNLDNVREQKNTFTGSFIIKKPDLAGESKWTVIHDKSIDVKIVDTEWLYKLKNRDVSLSCGDRIVGTLTTHTFIDENLKVLKTDYYLDKIMGIESPKRKNQPMLEV